MNSIIIPESLPEILKNYVKAAIRSQPDDIISWSAEYFKSADEPCPPTGEHDNSSSYKQGRTLFRILAFQLGTTVGTKERIEEVWSDLSLDFNLLQHIYRIGQFDSEHMDMVEFLGITFGHWTKSLKETVLLCCEAFCKCLATDGYFLHVDVACKLYSFLAKLDCSLPANEDNGHHANERNARRPMVKTSKSLDTSAAPPLEKKFKSNVFVSLESIYIPPMAANGCRQRHHDSRYYVPGIGPSISDTQVGEVLEYFQKCAVNNGGYVYDFDIENDQCPRLDAVKNN